MSATHPLFSLSGRVSGQVDGALVNVRWLLGVLAWLTLIFDSGAFFPNQFILTWVILLAAFNLLLMLALRMPRPSTRVPLIGLLGDTLLFGVLPHLPGVNDPSFFLFGLFPTLVAALRFGAWAGAFVAGAIVLPYELRAFPDILPSALRGLPPLPSAESHAILPAFLPIIALFGAVIFIGVLAQREREAALGDAAVELEELRSAMAGAKLFYETTDVLSTTLSYSRVLEVMLEAGTNGMPPGRREDGPAVAIALFFDETDSAKSLKVVGWRHLDRSDAQRRIPGKSGVVAETLEKGDAVVFSDASVDPELSTFTTLRRCRAGACFPLQAGLNSYGIVILATPAPRLPQEAHLQLMRAFTNQAAVAFQNAQLYSSLRDERDHIIEAEASARAKLARDLHDGPTQSIASLAMRLDYINLLLEKDPEKAKREIEQARENITRVGKELRGLLFTLRPLTLETEGLSAALEQWQQRLHDIEGIPLDVDPGNFGTELDANTAGTIFSVIEEAVTNARKHAPGAPIRVRVSQLNGNLVATIQDQGSGFDVQAVTEGYSQRGSLGMVNMRDRARLVDGKLAVDSAPGEGTRITLVVPLGDERIQPRATERRGRRKSGEKPA